MRIIEYSYVCLTCGRVDIFRTQDTLEDVRKCENCGGHSTLNDLTVRSIPEPQPLLSIEVMDMNSVPRVIYKGEDVTGKVSINYEWMTKGASSGTHSYELEYFNGKDDETVTLKKVSEKKE